MRLELRRNRGGSDRCVHNFRRAQVSRSGYGFSVRRGRKEVPGV